jgi:hypothetical protein
MVWREERTFGGDNRIGLGSPMGSKWRPATEIGLGSPMGATGDVFNRKWGSAGHVEAAPALAVLSSAGSPFALTFIHLPPVIQPMEIVFKSPAQPQSHLNLDDCLAQRPWETSWALLCAIRDATFATYLEKHRSLLLGYLKALQIQESLFRRVLGNLTVNWVPTAREEQIIQAAYHGFYPDDIEGAFCKYGGLYRIIALIVVFRNTSSILKQ